MVLAMAGQVVKIEYVRVAVLAAYAPSGTKAPLLNSAAAL